jgi:hypothetical protein
MSRYVGVPIRSGPAGNRPAVAGGDSPGTHKRALKSGSGGSTRKRKVGRKRR